MAFNGSGVWTFTTTTIAPTASSGTVIDSSDHNTLVADLTAGFNACLPRNGEADMSGDLKISKASAKLNVDSTSGANPAEVLITNDADDQGLSIKVNADESIGLYRTDGSGASPAAIFTTGTADQAATFAGAVAAASFTADNINIDLNTVKNSAGSLFIESSGSSGIYLNTAAGSGTGGVYFGNGTTSTASVAANGTLAGTQLNIDNVRINANTIDTTSGDLNLSTATGNTTVESITFNGTVITGATSITSTAFVGDLTGGIVETGSSVVMNMKVMTGAWDMDTDASKTVAHGLTLSKIRSIDISVLNTAGNSFLRLDYAPTSSATEGYNTCNGTNVVMYRTLAGTFDAAAWNAATYNIVIWYTD